MLHKDVAADALQFAGHALAVGGQGVGDVNLAVYGADRTGGRRVANQANGFARRTQADGHLRAHWNELKVLAKHLAAQVRLLVAAVVAHLVAQQAGTDAQFEGLGC